MSPHDTLSLAGGRRPLPLEVAVIGSGIAGLGAAWLLSKRYRVTLYEREPRLGGHTNTVRVKFGGREIAVDTGFIVYNQTNYPNLVQLFAHLGVTTHATDMSFSVSLDRGRFEYLGGEWSGLLAQPANLLRPTYWRMLGDTLRFFREAPLLLAAPPCAADPTLGDYLGSAGYSRSFVEDHLLPMGAAIWSVPMDRMRDFPARSFVRFFANHGLLQATRRPKWRTVTGGAAEYVSRIAASLPGGIRLSAPVVGVKPDGSGVIVRDARGGARRFDRVVIAAHANQALAMLERPTAQERRVLGAMSYQPNLAVLHRDPALMPRRRRAWASWNYIAERNTDCREAEGARSASVTYWMNRLQKLDPACPLFVSLNPLRAPRDELTIAAFEYQHPAFDAATLAAQAELASIQGVNNIWFCGSWCGYGFHEDALASGLACAEALGARRPWAAGAEVLLPARARGLPVLRPVLAPGAGD
jgi:predicted NAD/FAD-binding protein